MIRHVLAGIGVLFVMLAGVSDAAQAPAPGVMQPALKARVVVVERLSLGLIVRFDRPVDHAGSFLAIIGNGAVIRTLRPRLEAEPNVVFARTSMLPPGDYALHWSVHSLDGENFERGSMPFTVTAADPGAGIAVLAECG